mmetsp:Transcript_32694/g.62706  ORF Transcript_32694/g.62706 Transcript_32694/m.62706 type:complete len:83 (-) Transcript_32694:1447-1695(-)
MMELEDEEGVAPTSCRWAEDMIFSTRSMDASGISNTRCRGYRLCGCECEGGEQCACWNCIETLLDRTHCRIMLSFSDRRLSS